MKKTKRILAAVLALAMVLGMALNVFAIPDDYDWAAQSRAVDTYQVLYNAVYDKNNRPMRDDFAGAWYDQDKKVLVVAVTENCDMNFYRELLKGYDNAEFVTHKYPLKALRTLQDEVFDKLLDIMSGAGVDESENVIDFMVRVGTDEAKPRILQAMTEIKNAKNLPDGIENAFRVEYGIVEPMDDEGYDDDAVIDRPQEAHITAVTYETV